MTEISFDDAPTLWRFISVSWFRGRAARSAFPDGALRSVFTSNLNPLKFSSHLASGTDCDHERRIIHSFSGSVIEDFKLERKLDEFIKCLKDYDVSYLIACHGDGETTLRRSFPLNFHAICIIRCKVPKYLRTVPNKLQWPRKHSLESSSCIF